MGVRRMRRVEEFQKEGFQIIDPTSAHVTPASEDAVKV